MCRGVGGRLEDGVDDVEHKFVEGGSGAFLEVVVPVRAEGWGIVLIFVGNETEALLPSGRLRRERVD